MFAVAFCPSSDIFIANPWQNHHRALQACIAGPPDNWSSKAILAQNRGGRRAAYESWIGDREATRSGPIGLAETRGNGYVIHPSINPSLFVQS